MRETVPGGALEMQWLIAALYVGPVVGLLHRQLLHPLPYDVWTPINVRKGGRKHASESGGRSGGKNEAWDKKCRDWRDGNGGDHADGGVWWESS